MMAMMENSFIHSVIDFLIQWEPERPIPLAFMFRVKYTDDNSTQMRTVIPGGDE